MSLELNQLRHNQAIVGGARQSASLNPKNAGMDAQSQILRGAEIAAAGGILGLSEEETLAYASRQARRQSRADDQVSEADVIRKINQASKSLTDGLENPEIRGIGYETVADVDPFGQDQSEFQKFSANDRGWMEDEETGLLVEEPYETKADAVAPKSALQTAYNELEAERRKQASLGGRISRVFGGKLDVDPRIARVQGGLEDYIDETGQAQKAQTAIGEETVRRDSARFSPDVQEANDWRAQAEASVLGRDYVLGGPGAAADAAIARIGDVRSLGKAKTGELDVRRESTATFPTAMRTEEGIYIDPRTRQPIEVTEPVAAAGPNTPETTQMVNAPTRQWITDAMPDYRQGGRVYGDYPQVDITGATTLVADRLRGLGQKQPTVYPGLAALPEGRNIRSVEDLENAVNYVIERGGDRNKYYSMEKQPDGGVKSVRSTNPGTQEVLNLLRYTPQESQELAGAMYQLDSARRSSINQNPESQYRTRTGPYGSTERVMFESPEAINPNEGYAPIAKISRGVKTKDGRQVSEQFRGLGDSEAQKPFIGAIAGEREKRVRKYNPGMPAEKIREVRQARGQNSTPEDQNKTRSLMKESLITKQRAERDATRRAEREANLSQYIPSSMKGIRRY